MSIHPLCGSEDVRVEHVTRVAATFDIFSRSRERRCNAGDLRCDAGYSSVRIVKREK
jgi:hypothetical protein